MSISILAIAFAAVLVVGFVLFIRGLRGRRVGDEPRCRKCGYNLTGLTGEQCPECGSGTVPENIVIGTRVRRRPSLVAGTMLLLACLAGLALVGYGRVKNVNWYPYYPKFVLFQRARDDDRLAIDELRLRFKDGRLRAAAAQDVISLALARHGAEPAPPQLQAWCDLVAQVYAIGGLSPGQLDRYLTQLVTVEMQVRPRIRVGDANVQRFTFRGRGSQLLPLGVKYATGDGPKPDYLVTAARRWHNLPSDCVGESQMISYSSRWFTRWPSGSRSKTRQPEPGQQSLESVFLFAAFDEGADPEKDDPVWQREIVLSAETEFVGSDEPDPITLVKDPALGEKLERLLTCCWAYREPSREGGRDHYSFVFDLAEPVGVDLAFEVIAVAEGIEYRAGSAYWRRGTKTWAADPLNRRIYEPPIPSEVEEVEVVLRTSREVASFTLDCFEIWDGELYLGRVELTIPERFRRSSNDE